MDITAIVLTFNEEIHIERCINNIKLFANKITVVDCGSTDDTIDIIKKFDGDITILKNQWKSHGEQFNWALDQLPKSSGWIIRIDADEILDSELIFNIKNQTFNLDDNIHGIYFRRYIKFQNFIIKYGGVGGIKTLRMFKYGFGRSDTRLQDEHIHVEGRLVSFSGVLLDDNLNNLSWWINKHNKYSSNEAYEYFLNKYVSNNVNKYKHLNLKVYFRNYIYYLIPKSIRAFSYFIYRYIFLVGFLDGTIGFKFHFLQAFWYRLLVDAKIDEIEFLIKNNDKKNIDLFLHKLNIK